MSNDMNVEINNSEYKILIVDDVLSNILLLKILLTNEKYQICTAMGGVEALEKIKSEKPDLVLLDIMMPDMDGFEVLRQVRNMPQPFNDILIIFLSALNDTNEIVKGFQMGGNDYITKPFSKEELVIRVRHQISLVAARRVIQKQNEELRSTISSRDKMYSVLAHDLRSPIGSIKMIINMLVASATREKIGEESYDLLTLADSSAEETFALLDNLLKWTKSQTGNIKVVNQEFDFVGIARDIFDIFGTMAEMKQIDLKLEAPQYCNVYCDGDMLKSVLRNLVSNALKFTNNGGIVRIIIRDNVKEEGGKAVVSVEDNGCGMSEEAQGKLLKTETHFTTSGTNNEKGSGLGLLLCQDFVNKNGGRLWFKSSEGVGTCFNFSVPKK